MSFRLETYLALRLINRPNSHRVRLFVGRSSCKAGRELLCISLSNTLSEGTLPGGSDPHFKKGLTSLAPAVEGFRVIGEKVAELAAICQDRVIEEMKRNIRDCWSCFSQDWRERR